MDARSHRRSASTTTRSLNESALTTRRPKAHTDRGVSAESHERRKDAEGASDGSDMTSSDDFELDDIASDDGLEDDEETGLTSQDRQKRKKRKRRGTLLNERIAPGADTRQEELRLANSSFWSAIIMNSILIGLWYLFSIAITVVRIHQGSTIFHNNLTSYSTTNGCSKATMPMPQSCSPFLYLRPVYICSFSSPSRLWSSSSYHNFGPDTTLLTHTSREDDRHNQNR
jgi:hypothetical protein